MTSRIVLTIPKPGTFQGPQGPTGPTGAEGPQGPQGDPGPDTELRARVDPGTALAAGEYVVAGTGGVPQKVKDRLYNVKHPRFGATGDGATDDTAAIQAALDAAGLAGGGVVYFPKGTYNVNTTTTDNGITIGLYLRYDNVVLDGDGPDSVIFTTQSSHLLHVHGGNKANGFVDWHLNLYVVLTGYTINAASMGAMTVTTSTAANAGNLAAGDLVQIATGQLVTASTAEPDAEINEVVSVNAGTGVVTLRYPLIKDYAQEYYVSGTTGLTTRSVTANAAPLVIRKVTNATLRNIAIRNLSIEQRATGVSRAAILGNQVWDLDLHNVTLVSARNCFSMSNIRWGAHDRVRYVLTDASTVGNWGGAGTGSSNLSFTRGQATAATVGNFQINEGVTDITLADSVFINSASGSSQAVLSSGQRGRRQIITRNRFVNSGGASGSLISITPGTDTAATGLGGEFTNNILEGGAWTIGVNCTAPGWVVEPNEFRPASGAGVTGHVYKAPTTGSLKTAHPTYVLDGWLDVTNQTIELGILPIGAYVTAVHCHVTTAFNSDGTDQVSIGEDDTPLTTRYLALTDVASIGVKTVTAASAGYRSTAYSMVKAYYVNGGSEPTLGKVYVAMDFRIAPIQP